MGWLRKWSMIASHLPGRTDNEIKNHWNSRLSRQSYRFLTNKNKEKTSIDIATLVNQKKRRVGRVSRSVAKKYNQNMRFPKNNKSSSLTTTKKSSPSALMHEQVDENVGDYSNFVTEHMKESQVVYDNVISDELESNLLVFQDDEPFNIDYLLQDSSGVSSIHDEDQIEQWLAEIDDENIKKNERNVNEKEDESLSLNSSKTMEVCCDEIEWDMEFDFTGFNMCYEEDDMLLSLWEGADNP